LTGSPQQLAKLNVRTITLADDDIEAVFYPDTLGLGGNRKNWGVAKFDVPKAPRSEAPKAPRGVGSGEGVSPSPAD